MLYSLLRSSLLMWLSCAIAQAHEQPFEDLEIDQLMLLDIQNTSVMKRAASLDQTPASVYILTADKIKATGAQNITEVVDLIPGVFLRYKNNNQPVVAIRKVPASAVNNLLLMIDGRPIYNPLFPEIPWNTLGISVNNIERVELIRGSGGLIWSSQAANSVINIITKHSFDNQKNILSVATGTKFQRLTELQLAGLISDSGSYNLNLKGHGINRSESGETKAFDAQSLANLAFRLDYNVHDELSFLISGNYFKSDIEQSYGLVQQPLYRSVETQTLAKNKNADIMLRIDHHLSDASSQQLQFSYNDTDTESNLFQGGIKLLNINYAINYQLNRHKWGWGLDYQHNKLIINNNEYITYPENAPQYSERMGGYLQHEYLLANDKTRVFSNLRVDKVDGKFEYQPSLKITHSLAENTSIWSSLSRSVMTPTELEKYIVLKQESSVTNPLVAGGRVPSYIVANPNFAPEVQKTLEVGYRTQFHNTQIDFSIFHSRSSNATAAKVDFLATPRINISNVNSATSRYTGAEFIVNQTFSPKWQLEFSASYLDQDINTHGEGIYQSVPSEIMQQYTIRSDYQFSDKFSSYMKIDYEGGYTTITNASIPDYTTLDAGVTWQANKKLNIGLYGHNLLNDSHLEVPVASSEFFKSTKIERSFLIKAEVVF